MHNLTDRIRDNLARVRDRIATATDRVGRTAEHVTLVGVTKYADVDAAAALYAAGCHDLGESRPQELWKKAAALAGEPIRWHLVGHLQRNKVRRTLPLVELIHSIDSRRLLAAVEDEACALGHRARVLLEINVAGESAKHGFAPCELDGLFDGYAGYEHIEVCGLMTMARREGGRDTTRGDFARLRELRDRLRPNCPEGVRLDELSMGMSGDFEVAIEEGATIVRVGSLLFEGVVA